MTNHRKLPRVGCLGVGWIGLTRLQALAEAGVAEIVGVADPDPDARQKAFAAVPGAAFFGHYDELLRLELDGLVVATPSALHAEQCVRAFHHGLAVFCQKPLARTLAETEEVLEAARSADRLLRVDFCYRETEAMRAVHETVRRREIGQVYAGELVFHNAYGPDKRWAQDPSLAGGGCLIDLGVHLIDAALWVLGSTTVSHTSARLFQGGKPLVVPSEGGEDFAVGQLELSDGTTLSLACSWRSSFGDHARIRVGFFGTQGGVAFENVAGSFYDFACDRYSGASRERLVSPPDPWGGRAVIAWAEELASGLRYQPAEDLRQVARIVDGLYGRMHRPEDLPERSSMLRRTTQDMVR